MFIYSINSVRALQQDIVIESVVFKPVSAKYLTTEKCNGCHRTMINTKTNSSHFILGFEICITFSHTTSENSKEIKEYLNGFDLKQVWLMRCEIRGLKRRFPLPFKYLQSSEQNFCHWFSSG